MQNVNSLSSIWTLIAMYISHEDYRYISVYILFKKKKKKYK